MKAAVCRFAVGAVSLLLSLDALGQPYDWFNTAGLAGYWNFGWVDGTNADARLGQPAGIAIDFHGNLFLGDMRNNMVRKVSHLGTNWVVTTLAGNTNNVGLTLVDGTNLQARFYNPQGVAVDGAGNIYVADSSNNAVRKVRPLGTNWVVTTIATGLNFPDAITVDAATNLYVADFNNAVIRKLTPVGTNWVVSTIAGLIGHAGSADGTNSDARFNLPNGVALDSQGNLYVADYFNDTVRLLTTLGTNWVVSTIAGTAGVAGLADGTNSDARFNSPEGVAVDSAGNVFVSEFTSVRKISHSGTNWVVTTLTQANTSFYWNQPNALAFDTAGNLFVADTYNNVIRLGQPLYALQATAFAGQLVLAWPVTASNYFVETSPALGSAALWTALTNAVSLSGNTLVLTNSPFEQPAFFRLHRP